MALIQEVWLPEIQKVIFDNNEFFQYAVDHASLIENGTVHIPQAGDITQTHKTPSVPLTITGRTDTDFTYSILEFSTDAMNVRSFEDLQLSYAKRASVTGHQVEKLADRLAQECMVNWATSSSSKIVRTTGSGGTANAPDGSGSRKKLVKADIIAMAKVFDKDNVPSGNRYLMLPTEMYYEALDINEAVNGDFVNKGAVGTAKLPNLFGFNLLQRPSTVVYNSGATAVNAVGATTLASDNYGAIAWHSSFVAKAMGDINIYLREKDPQYLGDIVTISAEFGSKYMRADEKGIGAIVQEA